MRLFIRIQNGKPFEHPILENNFCQAFPDVDIDNLPPEFANFVRVESPILGPYEKELVCEYQLIDGAWTDVWSAVQMTDDEKLAKQNAMKQLGAPYPSWVFDEVTCSFAPPVPYPGDATNRFVWNESQAKWVYVPPRPTVAGVWNFDIDSGVWIEVSA